MRPSARLRQSVDSPAPPRRIKPNPVVKGKAAAAPSVSPPPTHPPFPPPNVMLHSEDANNKVLLAIGRSFVSVDNKAMTIKDLAEMTMKYGLMCQNVSAAGQAITTYIRNHLQRCELQQDHPLLLRHVLSGTPSDDDLVPALHSRVGGAHCTLNPSDKRITNFRRGTMVWYLSRAAGAPCPFARAGIRLCEYTENGKKGTEINPGKERKRERDRLRRAEQCGQKRKRLLRACADKITSSDSDITDDEEPQSKRPLTLRLPPLQSISELKARSTSPAEVIDLSSGSESDSSDESMSAESSSSSDEDSDEDQEGSEEKSDFAENAWHQPPCLRQSEALDGPSYDTHSTSNESYESPERHRRSPSVPHSVVSAPPDTEDDEDFDTMMDDDLCSSNGHWDSDDMFADLEFGADTDTQWDSPGPTSPPSQFQDEGVRVKQEPRDVQGLLDSWEDNMDRKVIDIVERVVAGNYPQEESKVKEEEFALDDLLRELTGNDFVDSPLDERALFIKEEEEEDIPSFKERFSSSPSMSPMTPFTPFSPSTSYFRSIPIPNDIGTRKDDECSWADAELFSPHDVDLRDLDNGVYQESDAKRERSQSKEPLAQAPLYVNHPDPSQIVPLPGDVSQRLKATEVPVEKPPTTTPLPARLAPNLLQEPLHDNTDTPIRHIHESSESSQSSDRDEGVVVDTLTPCVPAIWATTFEGISVYQMVLGSSHIFRRIDTDFVNITPILQFLGLPLPDPETLPSAVVISRGDSLICGTWVHLATARRLVHDEPLVGTFLSDELHEKFPQALQDFHRSSLQGRSLKQFGPLFQSAAAANNVDNKREAVPIFRVELPPRMRRWAVEDHLLSVHPPFALRAAAVVALNSDDVIAPETPLSPTEEEIFHALCGASDWEQSPSSVATAPPCVVKDAEGALAAPASLCAEEEEEPEDAPAALTPAEPVPCREREKERERERPLRRSKRVANAAFIRTRTRSAKRGSRTLS